jgi:dihydrofolate synthase/folylpolyglutamate synthase
MQNDKDCEGFLEAFRGLVASVTTVPVPGESRMHTASGLADIVKSAGFTFRSDKSLSDALRSVVSNPAPGHILITGSHLLVGAALSSNRTALLDR